MLHIFGDAVNTLASERCTTTEKNAYQKRQRNVPDVEVIKLHLSAARDSHSGKDETPITAETVPLGVDDYYHPGIR